MKQFYLIILGVICCGLISCAETPNSIAMGVTQGQCLTGGVDDAPANNPAYAQYCMAVTLQNNNSGQNANNVQVTSDGLTLSYSALANGGTQSFSSDICDSNASDDVCPSGTNQIGNITIYDPNNCATQQGSKVTTLMANGGTCTFYLQLSAESFAVGSYPINITYNYTNSNQNYSISTNIYQNVDLYAGGSNGVYSFNSGTWESFITGVNNVNAIIHDEYGNVYFNSDNSIFEYNGSSTTQLGTDLASKIYSLTVDGDSNLIAATENGLYYFNVNSSTEWTSLEDTNNLIGNNAVIGVSYTELTNNTIYAIEADTAYSCVESSTTLPTIACTVAADGGPSQFYQNSLAAYDGYLYTGTSLGFYSYLESWLSYTLSLTSLTLNSINSIPIYVSSVFANSLGEYIGLNQSTISYCGGSGVCSPLYESAIYYCTSGACTPQASGSGNYVVGNIFAITLDGANYIYGTGSNLSSGDFSSTNVSGVYESGSSTTVWQPITGDLESSSALTAVSSLVN